MDHKIAQRLQWVELFERLQTPASYAAAVGFPVRLFGYGLGVISNLGSTD